MLHIYLVHLLLVFWDAIFSLGQEEIEWKRGVAGLLMKTFLLVSFLLSLFLWRVYVSRDCFSFLCRGFSSEEPLLLHAWCFMFKHAYWWKVDTLFLLHLLNKLVVLPIQASLLFIILHQSVNLHIAAEAYTFPCSWILIYSQSRVLKAKMWAAVKSLAP